MSRALFRQTAMIAAMQGQLAFRAGWEPTELAKRSIGFADALLEANTITEDADASSQAT